MRDTSYRLLRCFADFSVVSALKSETEHQAIVMKARLKRNKLFDIERGFVIVNPLDLLTVDRFIIP